MHESPSILSRSQFGVVGTDHLGGAPVLATLQGLACIGSIPYGSTKRSTRLPGVARQERIVPARQRVDWSLGRMTWKPEILTVVFLSCAAAAHGESVTSPATDLVFRENQVVASPDTVLDLHRMISFTPIGEGDEHHLTMVAQGRANVLAVKEVRSEVFTYGFSRALARYPRR